jgi:hypothetical protein
MLLKKVKSEKGKRKFDMIGKYRRLDGVGKEHDGR